MICSGIIHKGPANATTVGLFRQGRLKIQSSRVFYMGFRYYGQEYHLGAKLFPFGTKDQGVSNIRCYGTKCPDWSCKDGYGRVTSRSLEEARLLPNPSRTTINICRWIGNSACADAKCAQYNVALLTNECGDTIPRYHGYRDKTNWHTVRRHLKKGPKCDNSLFEPDSGPCAEPDFVQWSNQKLSCKGLHRPQSRGGKRQYRVKLKGLAHFLSPARPYASRSMFFRSDRHWPYQLFRYYRLRNPHCVFTGVSSDRIDRHNILGTLPIEAETEHLVPLSLHTRFIEVANTGWLRGSRRGSRATRAPPVDSAALKNLYYGANTLRAGLSRVARFSPNLRSPVDRVWEAFGSTTNRENMVMTQRQINAQKQTVFDIQRRCSESQWHRWLRLLIEGDRTITQELLGNLRMVLSVFRYHQIGDVAKRTERTRDMIRDQYKLIGREHRSLRHLADHWSEFYDDYVTEIEEQSRDYLIDRINMTRDALRGLLSRHHVAVRRALNLLEDDVKSGVLLPR
ncbi:conserved hypothetical protein [Coccidioides posadasii str. Silveira]|uniref:Uncharacterized protein n=2 Tax=Coccidioides posadasii (strain RMSCC 757 / Silveira) TaxID=443226 RepID=E9CS86_COCPS|nr:conserved hypothetical protein [Coccidioides posadasii str. Silveira]